MLVSAVRPVAWMRTDPVKSARSLTRLQVSRPVRTMENTVSNSLDDRVIGFWRQNETWLRSAASSGTGTRFVVIVFVNYGRRRGSSVIQWWLLTRGVVVVVPLPLKHICGAIPLQWSAFCCILCGKHWRKMELRWRNSRKWLDGSYSCKP